MADHLAEADLGYLVVSRHICVLLHQLLELFAQMRAAPVFPCVVHGLQSMSARRKFRPIRISARAWFLHSDRANPEHEDAQCGSPAPACRFLAQMQIRLR